MRIDLLEPVELRDTDNGYMAETEILVLGEVVGYVGASRYVSSTHEDALDVLRDVFKPLIDAIKAHPDVNEKSRFEYDA